MERPSPTSFPAGRWVAGVDNAAVPGVEAVAGRLYPPPRPPPAVAAASPCGVGGTSSSLEEPLLLCGRRPPAGVVVAVVDVPARRPMLVEAFGGGGRSPASGGIRDGSALTSPSLASPRRVVQVVWRNTESRRRGRRR